MATESNCGATSIAAVAVAAVTRAGPVRQHQRRKHVGGRGGGADDVQADRVRPVAVAPLHDRLEHRQRAASQGIETAPGSGIARQHLDQAGQLFAGIALLPFGIVQALRQHGMMDAGVLAQVERRQVEPEGVDARQQAPHQEAAGMQPAIGAQAVDDQGDVAAQLRQPVVAVGPAVERVAQAFGDLPEEHAVRHAIMAQRRQRRRAGQQRAVLVDAARQRRRYRHAPGTLRQLLRQRLAFLEILVDDDLLLPRQRLADALGMHIGGAIHVTAHPAAEAHQQRQLQRVGVDAIEARQRRGDLVVEHRHDPVQHFGEIEDGVLALVGHRQQFARVLAGLPVDGDVGADAIQQRLFFLRREHRVAVFQQPVGNALLAVQPGAARRLGRMRHQHRFDAQLPQQFQHVLEPETLRLELGQGGDHSLRLRPAAVGEEILAAPADAVHFLRHVGQLEIGGEGAQQVARQLRAPPLHARAQLERHAGAAAAAANRRLAVAFGQLVEFVAALLAQHAADQRAEGVYVLAQRAVVRREMEVVAVHGGSVCTARAGRALYPQPLSRPAAPLRHAPAPPAYHE